MIYFFHHYELPAVLQQARVHQLMVYTQQHQQETNGETPQPNNTARPQSSDANNLQNIDAEQPSNGITTSIDTDSVAQDSNGTRSTHGTFSSNDSVATPSSTSSHISNTSTNMTEEQQQQEELIRMMDRGMQGGSNERDVQETSGLSKSADRIASTSNNTDNNIDDTYNCTIRGTSVNGVPDIIDNGTVVGEELKNVATVCESSIVSKNCNDIKQESVLLNDETHYANTNDDQSDDCVAPEANLDPVTPNDTIRHMVKLEGGMEST